MSDRRRRADESETARRGTGSLFESSAGAAARGAHAAAHARRDRRATASARAGQAAARSDRARHDRLDAVLGPAGLRQDDDRARRSRATPIASSCRSPPSPKACRASARSSPRPRGGAGSGAGRFSSPTRSIASTRRSRTRFCRTSKRARSRSSARRRRIRRSRSSARCSRGCASSCSSRCRRTICARLVDRALADRERGLGDLSLAMDDDAADLIATEADGDARRALTMLAGGRRSRRAQRTHHRRRRAGSAAAPLRQVRQGRRRDVQHAERVPQKSARQRSAGRALLDGRA